VNGTTSRFEELAFPLGRERDACGVGTVSAGRRKVGRLVLDLALRAIVNLEHRGARMPDGTGDGAGFLMDIPRAFLAREVTRLAPGTDDPLREGAGWSVATLFLPRDLLRERVEAVLTPALAGIGRSTRLAAWRDVPLLTDRLPASAAESAPAVAQLVLHWDDLPGPVETERFVFMLQGRLEEALRAAGLPVYVVSCSDRTLVYKGLLDGHQLGRVYPDLLEPDVSPATVVFHRRFATNTTPNWNMCQPFRLLCHNGEINTIAGNRHGVTIWERYVRQSGRFDPDWPTHALVPGQSDSADLDQAVHAYHAEGRSLAYTIAALMPPSWENRVGGQSVERKALFEFHKRAMGGLGAWEGPAAVIAYDGHQLVASLDRMGLRPLRVMQSDDGLLTVSSESGVLDRDPGVTVFRHQLEPGGLIRFDLEGGRVLQSTDVYFDILREAAPRLKTSFRELNSRQVYGPSRYGSRDDVRNPDVTFFRGRLGAYLRAWGWDSRLRQDSTDHLIDVGKEEIYSMGHDRALACLSMDGPTVYKYFHQRFALVTNPPIDPYREGWDMSLVTYLGRKPDVPPRTSPDAFNLKLKSPVLTSRTLVEILGSTEIPARELPLTFPAGGNGAALGRALETLAEQAVQVVRDGRPVVVLSDRGCFGRGQWPLPAPLAVAFVNDRLSDEGLRPMASLVVQVGEVSEGHDVAVLLALGADAVHPHALLRYALERGKRRGRPVDTSIRQVQEGLEESLRKIMSKMGIATVQGYADAGLFEAVGLGPDVMRFVPRIPSRVGGVDLDTLARDIAHRVRHAVTLDELPRFDADERSYNDPMRRALWRVAVTGERADWEAYRAVTDGRRPAALRDLVQLAPPDAPADAPAVDPLPAEQVLADCVVTGGMSLGALTENAHEAIAWAANRLGVWSNSGEGGEDRARNRGGAKEAVRSRIRQVATGRFGVDAEYLVNADEIQIKMAQGAKPGEGGQLMSAKVTPEIARLRYCRPGIDLISPPPHHDIYSIEDLKQLVYDLRAVNPEARVSVKLCAVTGIGTIAAGVVKAGADVIEIDGLEGSTGASPRSSLEHAGLPTELGLREVHLALTALGLRDLVRLRAGGGVKTETDAVKYLLFGADQVTIATTLMIAQGCVHCNLCHTGQCPTLIAGNRNPRALWPGSGAHVERFLRAFGEGIARLVARLGAAHPRELVGRSDLLRRRSRDDLARDLPETVVGAERDALLDRYERLDLTLLTAAVADRRVFAACDGCGSIDNLDRTLQEQVAADSDLWAAVDEGRVVERSYLIHGRHSIDFAVGVAGRIAGRWGRDGWPGERPIELGTVGTAGQSYGAFCVKGLSLVHTGSCNDGVGKGMSGGRIVVRQPEGFAGRTWQHMLIGNTAAFGATGGTLFVHGRAGQRLAVRNSGATIVCEGAGRYACEYMTAGTVVFLGPVGESIGAGMTDGRIFVYDPEGDEETRSALDNRSVAIAQPTEDELFGELLPLLDEYYAATRSARAREARQNIYDFHKVIPNSAVVEELRRKLAVDLGQTIAG
jgi:glutamate synthase domain-containing protein 2/glutamate synthase domain-containing protein 1/glutamate synthase domain-containing protein 3